MSAGRPDKGTDEYALWVAACQVALDAPLRPSRNGGLCQIRWASILELRAALDALEVDWRPHHRSAKRPQPVG